MIQEWQKQLERNGGTTLNSNDSQSESTIISEYQGMYSIESTAIDRVSNWQWEGAITAHTPKDATRVLEEFEIDPQSGWK